MRSNVFSLPYSLRTKWTGVGLLAFALIFLLSGQVAPALPDPAFRSLSAGVGFTQVPPKGKLTTDKAVYRLGETVTIIFSNVSSQTITLPNPAPWVVKDSQGRVVFSPVSVQVITPVKPGGTARWTWDQKDKSGQQVPPGSYTVELNTMDAGTYKAGFQIGPQAKVTTDKPFYRLGETVTIIFSNVSYQVIELPGFQWAIKDPQGRVVFAPPPITMIVRVQPGETKRWSWDQKDKKRGQVPPGSYTVELKTGNAGTYSAGFQIR